MLPQILRIRHCRSDVISYISANKARRITLLIELCSRPYSRDKNGSYFFWLSSAVTATQPEQQLGWATALDARSTAALIAARATAAAAAAAACVWATAADVHGQHPGLLSAPVLLFAPARRVGRLKPKFPPPKIIFFLLPRHPAIDFLTQLLCYFLAPLVYIYISNLKSFNFSLFSLPFFFNFFLFFPHFFLYHTPQWHGISPPFPKY